MTHQVTKLSCSCGEVVLEVEKKPITSSECLCVDCQDAGAFLQSLPGAPIMLDHNGATRFVLYRKDRVKCIQGQEQLREHRLQPDSKTRRVVATCCNTPMFLDFTNGHWLSIYGNLWPAEKLPPLELRTMTRERPEGVRLPDDVPNPQTHTLSFYGKLFGAWAAMGFRRHAVGYVHGELKKP